MPETEQRNSPLINTTLLVRCWRDGVWLLFACALALFAMAWARGFAVSMINMDSWKTILDILPEGLQKLFPVDYSWLITYTGRTALTYEEPIVFLCLAIWCLARSSDCVSGQLGRGTMEMLLAQPISRLQLIATHSFVTIIGIAVLSLASWLGLKVAIETSSVTEQVPLQIGIPYTPFRFDVPFTSREVESTMSEMVDADVMWAGTLNFFCAGLMLAGVTTLLSSMDRYRWRTLGVAAGFYIVQAVLVIIAALSPALAWLKWITILSAYKPSVCIAVADQRPEDLWSFLMKCNDGVGYEAGPLGYNALLIFVAVICYVIAAIIFQRRDLPAPV